MARPRKSVVENLKRQYGHDSVRILDRLAEPVPSAALGRAPAHLTKERKKLWKKLSASVPTGVATNADAIAFEMLVELVEKQREGKLEGSERTHLLRLLGEFGLTPASRSKVSAVKPAETKKNEFDELDDAAEK